MAKDYYNTLGVSKDASDEEIKKAYRKLAHKHHPDKQGGDEAKFKEINEAYQVLSDKEKRQQYDQYGQTFDQARSGGGSSGFEGFGDFSRGNGFGFDFSKSGGFEDIFSDIFGGMGYGNGGYGREPVGQDIAMDAEIDFYEMVKGAEREFNLYRKVTCDRCSGTGAEDKETETCPTCKGTGKIQRTARSIFGSFTQEAVCPTCKGRGKSPKKKCRKCGGDGVVRDYEKVKVKIPAGIEDGQTIRITGYGEMSGGAGRPGDLYLTIHLKAHRRFVRKGNDIYSKEEISLSQATLGDKIETETVDGKVKIKVPSGTQSGTFLKIRGAGVPKLGGFSRGDHLVELKVKIPEKLTSRQKELIERLKEEGL